MYRRVRMMMMINIATNYYRMTAEPADRSNMLYRCGTGWRGMRDIQLRMLSNAIN